MLPVMSPLNSQTPASILYIGGRGKGYTNILSLIPSLAQAKWMNIYGQPLFRNFHKIHPFWQKQASLSDHWDIIHSKIDNQWCRIYDNPLTFFAFFPIFFKHFSKMFASVYFVRLSCFWQNVEGCRWTMFQHIWAFFSGKHENDDDH